MTVPHPLLIRLRGRENVADLQHAHHHGLVVSHDHGFEAFERESAQDAGEGAWNAQHLAGFNEIQFTDRGGSTAYATIVRLNPRRMRALWNGQMVTVPYGLITGAS